MSYSFTGLGAYAAQVQNTPAECATRARKAAARVTCTILSKDCKTANLPTCPTCQSASDKASAEVMCRTLANIGPSCARAKIPVCRTTPSSALVQSNALVTAPPASTAPVPTKRAIPTRDHKVPVPEPIPEPIATEPPPGVPMWAWLVGGAAVVGGVAYFATRKKAA